MALWPWRGSCCIYSQQVALTLHGVLLKLIGLLSQEDDRSQCVVITARHHLQLISGEPPRVLLKLSFTLASQHPAMALDSTLFPLLLQSGFPLGLGYILVKIRMVGSPAQKGEAISPTLKSLAASGLLTSLGHGGTWAELSASWVRSWKKEVWRATAVSLTFALPGSF